MRTEAKLFLILVLFFGIVAPVYAFMTYRADGHVEPIGTTVFILSVAMTAMIWAYLTLLARKMDVRPEDHADGEIIDGAGALGFFPPKSIWPFWSALIVSIIFLGPVFGWWITILGLGAGIWAVTGWAYEFYIGEYSH